MSLLAKAAPPRVQAKVSTPAAVGGQRYFRIPFVRPSDQHRAGQQEKGWLVKHLMIGFPLTL